MMQSYTISLNGGVARNPLVRLAAPVSISFPADEHIAIVGPNGSGKSLLVDMLIGKYPLKEGTLTYDFSPSASQTVYDNVKYIAFRDTYGSADANYYYQQRWNTHDHDDVPLVKDMLGAVRDEALKQELFELFCIEPTAPRVLIMDNPFIGLDAQTRELLNTLLEGLAKRSAVQLILILSMVDDIPAYIDKVLPIANRTVGQMMPRDQYLTIFRNADIPVPEDLQQRIIDLPYDNTNYVSDEVVKLNKVSIRYGDRTILKELDWTVMRGQKWALSGENGAGKSTLLSLVCADNPQSYACDISLFGRKRGTGESIWEIKKHIGYVSPEMHRAYLKNLPAIEIVASGLHDSIGLYKRPKAEQMSVCEWWMDIFGIAALKDKPFLQLSSGEQRLALLARAFVKDPELLILDEPLHGLDTYNRRRVKKVIEAFCRRQDKTMIMVTHYERELPATISDRIFLKRNR